MRRKPLLVIRRIRWLSHLAQIICVHSKALDNRLFHNTTSNSLKMFLEENRRSVVIVVVLASVVNRQRPSKTFATFCFLDAPLASLLYFNQRHAHFLRQCERSISPAHRRAEAFHANDRPQCARGNGSLTNRKAGMQHPGHHPQARLVVFSFSAPL